MGSSSKSSSSSTSTDQTDSFNQTLTNSLSGNGALGVTNTGATTFGNDSSNALDYAYDSNNPITNNDQTYALGANSSASPSNSSAGNPAPSSGVLGDIDWAEVITSLVAGVILVYVLRLFGDRNS
jgi:hypothetical protein